MHKIINLAKKIFYSFDAQQKRRSMLLFCIILVSTFFELLCVPVVLPLVNLATSDQAITDNGFLRIAGELLHFQDDQQYIIFSLLIIIAVYVTKDAILLVLNRYQNRFIYQGQRSLMLRLMRCYVRQPYLFHTIHNVSEVQRDVCNDVLDFYTTVLTAIQVLTELLVICALAGYLLVQDFLITVLTLGILGIFFGTFMHLYHKKLKELGSEAREKAAESNKWMLQTFGGIKEVKTNNREEYFLQQFDDANKRYKDTLEVQHFLANIPRPVLEGFAITTIMLALLVRLLLTGDPSSTLATLAVFAVAAFRLMPACNHIMSCVTTLTFYIPSIDAVYQHLQYEKTQSQYGQSTADGLHFAQEMEVRDVCFTYPEASEPVLSQANLRIRKNQSVAIIGPSGAGKSTLADIMLGVLRPESGSVYLDGQDIFKDLPSWYTLIGYIPQTIYLLDDTIRANVAFGVDEKDIDEELLARALKEAQLDDFVRTLEDGVYTQVGERGVRLSGGQRQRIGIARALYREPQILILDEATSSLDNDTEQAVMQAIDSLQGQKTLIIIAHRLSTIRNCDVVYEVRQQGIRQLSEKERNELEKPM